MEAYINESIAIHFVLSYVVNIRVSVRFGAAGRAATEWSRFAIEAALLG
jgi:hypothetical protein